MQYARYTGEIQNIHGDTSKIWGVVSNRLYGDVSGLSGDVTGIVGDATGIVLNLNEWGVPRQDLEKGVDVRSFGVEKG